MFGNPTYGFDSETFRNVPLLELSSDANRIGTIAYLANNTSLKKLRIQLMNQDEEFAALKKLTKLEHLDAFGCFDVGHLKDCIRKFEKLTFLRIDTVVALKVGKYPNGRTYPGSFPSRQEEISAILRSFPPTLKSLSIEFPFSYTSICAFAVYTDLEYLEMKCYDKCDTFFDTWCEYLCQFVIVQI